MMDYVIKKIYSMVENVDVVVAIYGFCPCEDP